MQRPFLGLLVILCVTVGMSSAAAHAQTLTGSAPAPGSAPSTTTPPSKPSGLGGMTTASFDGCSDGFVCFWSGYEYSGGTNIARDCSVYGGLGWKWIEAVGHWFYSAKNRCGSRTVRMGHSTAETACMGPGANRPLLTASDRFIVGGGVC